jgi:hypothetical protein
LSGVDSQLGKVLNKYSYMKKITVIAAGLALLMSSVGVSAQTRPDYLTDGAIEAFRKVKDIPPIEEVVPTVAEMPFSEAALERATFLLLNVATGRPEAYSYRQEVFANKIPVNVMVIGTAFIGNGPALADDNQNTSVSFSVGDNPQDNVAIIALRSESAVTSSRLSLNLDSNVALPHSVEIRATGAQGEAVVVAKTALTSPVILFPKTTATEWRVTLWYSQPLRITELQLNQEGLEVVRRANIRFLAQPNASYELYFDADRHVQIRTPEAGNLSADVGVVKISETATRTNGKYVIADGDSDGIPDLRDNCIALANPDQVDVNTNGLGDDCDDFDRDGVMNSNDNCVNEPNRNQADEDGDARGDVCDDDESRVTEKYPWLPWAGMGSAALVLIVLFASTAKSLRRQSV